MKRKKKKETRENNVELDFMRPIEHIVLEKLVIGQIPMTKTIVYYILKKENGLIFDPKLKIVGAWKNNNIKLY